MLIYEEDCRIIFFSNGYLTIAKNIRKELLSVKETNWDKLRKKPAEETTKYRDVYEDQQLDRSEIQDKQTMTSRTIFVIFFTLIVGVITYAVLSFGISVYDSFTSNVATSTGTSNTESADAPPERDPNGIPEGWTEIYTMDGIRYQDQVGNVHTMDEALAQYEAEYQAKLDAYYASHSDVANSGTETTVTQEQSSLVSVFAPTPMKVGITFIVMILFFCIMEQYMVLNLKAQNLMNDMSDINQVRTDRVLYRVA